MKIALISALVCFVISLAIAPIIIKWLKKLKFGQSILVYVEQHKTKSGTPTMGGIIFLISGLVGFILFRRENNILATICMFAFLFFGFLGFLDDFIKIKFKQNEGLKPYQKIIGQVGISIIIAVFVYNSSLVGDGVILPFTDIVGHIGWLIIPFVMVFYIAVVNSVNLVDGLDGLCGTVTAIVLLVFSVILLIITNVTEGVYFNEVTNIIIVSMSVAGAILGFLCFNVYPAKVFMGDSGSLALGGLIATLFTLTRQYFLIFVVGFVFVMTAFSVVLQVASFKLLKKRVFKMSPIHHHFEMTTHESKVVSLYCILTLMLGFVSIILYL